AAEIWRMCDGTRTSSQIAQAMRKRNHAVDENAVRMMLGKFAKAGLLQNGKGASTMRIDKQRRQFLKAGTMIALPAMTSVLIPKAEQAVSCSTLLQPCNPRPCCGTLTCVVNRCV